MGAAARLAGVSPTALASRLESHSLPGYQLGRRWFIPQAELRRAMTSRVSAPLADGPAAAVHELTGDLPRVLDADTLAAFFGIRRVLLGDVLGIPRLAFVTRSERVTTVGVLGSTLLAGRNDSRYFPEHTRAAALRVA